LKRFLNKDGIFRLFGSAVIDQGLLSAANFAIGLLLIRYTDDVQYGHFVLVQATVLLVIALHRAYVVDPLTVLAPKYSQQIKRDMVAGLRGDLRFFLLKLAAVALLVPLALYFTGWVAPNLCVLVTLAILAGWAGIERDYLRGALMIYYRPDAVLGADVVYVSVLIAGVLFAVWLPAFAAAIATAALAVAAWAGTVPAQRSLARDPGLEKVDAAAYWQEMRPLAVWATVGALIFWVFGQGYNYMLALKLDAVAVAQVNAIRLMIMPVILLAIGTKALLLPMSVRWVTESGFVFLLKRITQLILALTALYVIYFVVLWESSDWLLINVLDKRIADKDFMLAMWLLQAFISLVRDFYLQALLVRKRFRQTAQLVAVTSTVTVAGLWFTIDWYGAAGALVGLVIGEFVFLFGVLWMLWRESRIQVPGEANSKPHQAP